MKINYTKGAFRLWLMVSMLWVIFCMLVFGSEAIKNIRTLPNKATFEKAYNLEYQKNLAQLSKEKLGLLAEATKRGLLPEITFEIPAEYSEPIKNGRLKLIPIPTPEILAKSSLRVSFRNVTKLFSKGTNGEKIWVEYESLIKQEHYKELMKLFGMLFIPPLFLLVFGLSLFWVINGFRNIAEPGA